MAVKKDDDMTDAAPPNAAQMMSVMDRLATALESLTARQQGGADPTTATLIETLSNALARVSETQLEGSKLIADETRRAARPSNQVVPQVSAFHRRGLKDFPDWKPKLKCLMMVPWLLEWESLTREEVMLFNLLEPGMYTVQRTDRSKIKVSVVIDYGVDEVTPSRLLLNHETAFNNDNKDLIPPMADVIRQILKQHSPEIAAAARDVLTDDEEEALIMAGELSVSV